jgi:galactokinase
VSGTSFVDLFGRGPEVTASAPGRVNLIGEHTDYNDGLVLPVTIPQSTRVELARRGGRLVRLWSANVAGAGSPDSYDLGRETRRHDWVDFPQGVTAVLGEAGFEVGGFDLRVESDLPLGGGLSSSAALLVAILRAVREAFALDFDDVAVAAFAHRAEYSLVGAPVGIMDQMVCSVGPPGFALFIDTQSRRISHVVIPGGLDLIVIDSGTRHSHASGEYRTRRLECEAAAARLGVASLRDVEADESLTARLDALPPVLARRVRHVVTENQRVSSMVHALTDGSLDTCGRILLAGHASLRDDFEVSTPEIDCLVDAAAAAPHVVGARLTGGGFGGSIVALAGSGHGRAAAEEAAEGYARRTGRQPTVLLPASAD